MKSLKKIYCLLVCMVYVFAGIGATAYLFYYKQPQFAIATLLLTAMAFPYAWKCFRALTGYGSTDNH